MTSIVNMGLVCTYSYNNALNLQLHIIQRKHEEKMNSTNRDGYLH